MNPIHEHDCKTCIHLGSDKENDYYFHRHKEHASLSTLIYRYGIDGDYGSGSVFCMCSVGTNKALELAYTNGILTEDEITHLKNIQDEWFDYCERHLDYKASVEKRWEGLTRFLLP